MKINRHYLKTPTEIVTTNLNIPKDYKSKCIQEAYKIGNSINNNPSMKTNLNSIRSSYLIWEETNIYDNLLDKIMYEIEDKIFPRKDPNYRYNLYNAWVAIYKNGHYATPHNHIPSTLSFVYYLKTPQNSTPLVFEEFNISPHEDLLTVFPSYLTHSVPIHKGEDRICLAGNLDLIPN